MRLRKHCESYEEFINHPYFHNARRGGRIVHPSILIRELDKYASPLDGKRIVQLATSRKNKNPASVITMLNLGFNTNELEKVDGNPFEIPMNQKGRSYIQQFKWFRKLPCQHRYQDGGRFVGEMQDYVVPEDPVQREL